MKNILIGVNHVVGDFKDGRKNVSYDNIVLYFADFNQNGCDGFSFKFPAAIAAGRLEDSTHIVKIKAAEMKFITGMTAEQFLATYQQKYMYHKAQILVQENEFGKDEVVKVRFSTLDCYKLYERELEERRQRDAERLAEEERERRERASKLANRENDDFEDLFEESLDDLYERTDTSTGEVK